MENKGRPKAPSVLVKVRFKRDVYEIIQEDAARNGVSVPAYLSMLASQKRIEMQAMRLVANIPQDKLLEMINQEQEVEAKK